MNPTQREAGAIPDPGLLVVAGVACLAWTARRAWVRLGPRRVLVEGLSMLPALQPGDRLLVCRAGGLQRGDIVAVLDPRDATRPLIKRVAAVTDAGLDVRGDNRESSTDSRDFGQVAPGAVIGRAVYRYGPAHRAGLLAPRGRAGS